MRKKTISKADIALIVAVILTVAFFIGAEVARAYKDGEKAGWRGCIEENNLYERYEIEDYV